MRSGVAPEAIEKNLVEKGLDAESARIVVGNLTEARTNVHKETGKKNMIYGALWCIGGTVITVWTYQAAAGPGGSRYVVAWGAIVFGAIQFFRGLGQMLSDPE